MSQTPSGNALSSGPSGEVQRNTTSRRDRVAKARDAYRSVFPQRTVTRDWRELNVAVGRQLLPPSTPDTGPEEWGRAGSERDGRAVGEKGEAVAGGETDGNNCELVITNFHSF